MKINARDEFKEHTKGKQVKCARIHQNDEWCWREEDEKPSILLPVGNTEEDYENFLCRLNFSYDSGFGGQELYGLIWYEDGSWSSRGEYDGSEWWEHNSLPEIPEELMK